VRAGGCGGLRWRWRVSVVTSLNYTVQASTNVVDRVPRGTNLSPFLFADIYATNYPQRFYRADFQQLRIGENDLRVAAFFQALTNWPLLAEQRLPPPFPAFRVQFDSDPRPAPGIERERISQLVGLKTILEYIRLFKLYILYIK
jgi:hypothetical protein